MKVLIAILLTLAAVSVLILARDTFGAIGDFPDAPALGSRVEFALCPNQYPLELSISFVKRPGFGWCLTAEGDFIVAYNGQVVGQWTNLGYFGDIGVQGNTAAVWRVLEQSGGPTSPPGNTFLTLDNRPTFGAATWLFGSLPVSAPTNTWSRHEFVTLAPRTITLTGGGTRSVSCGLCESPGFQFHVWPLTVKSDTPGTVVPRLTNVYFWNPVAGTNVTSPDLRVFDTESGAYLSTTGVFVDADTPAARAIKDATFKADFLRLLTEDAGFRAQVKWLLGIAP